ncbi:MAG: HAD family phosphatase [archaeon]
MIQAVIFDWGNVLIDNPLDKLISYCGTQLGIKDNELKREFMKYNEQFERGRILEKDLWKNICDKFGVGEPKTSSLWRESFDEIVSKREYIFSLVQELKDNRYKTGFLSNTALPTVGYFYDKDYKRYFDAEVFSCLEDSVKPEAKIYRRILEKLGVDAENALFTDDNNEFVKGFNKIGGKGILFENLKQLRKELKKDYSVRIN